MKYAFLFVCCLLLPGVLYGMEEGNTNLFTLEEGRALSLDERLQTLPSAISEHLPLLRKNISDEELEEVLEKHKGDSNQVHTHFNKLLLKKASESLRIVFRHEIFNVISSVVLCTIAVGLSISVYKLQKTCS